MEELREECWKAEDDRDRERRQRKHPTSRVVLRRIDYQLLHDFVYLRMFRLTRRSQSQVVVVSVSDSAFGEKD